MSAQKREQDLLASAEFLKGVGSHRAQLLLKLGLRTARDIVFFLPRDYRDLTQLTNIRDLEEGPTYRVVGEVQEVDLRESAGGRSTVGVLVKQENEYIRALWFNQPFMARQFRQGQRVVLTGAAKSRGFRWEMHHPKAEPVTDETSLEGGLQPVYRLTDGVSQYHMRVLVRNAVEEYATQVEEVFPTRLLDKYELLPIDEALRLIHHPGSDEDLRQARFRFAFQELFTMQLALAMRHNSVTLSPSPALPADGKIDARIKRLLPFDLTDGQQSVIREITDDMARERAMNRMLQGDVGSGKTMVAAYAMLVAIANKHQAVIMAPTEILARQHFQTMSHLLQNSHVRIGFLTGSLKAAQKRELLAGIADGRIDLVIGTQAVVQAGV
ncbi:MAG: DEAD/DEAH box helicase, partial [Planctomycetota bacterium]